MILGRLLKELCVRFRIKNLTGKGHWKGFGEENSKSRVVLGENRGTRDKLGGFSFYSFHTRSITECWFYTQPNHRLTAVTARNGNPTCL